MHVIDVDPRSVGITMLAPKRHRPRSRFSKRPSSDTVTWVPPLTSPPRGLTLSTRVGKPNVNVLRPFVVVEKSTPLADTSTFTVSPATGASFP